MKLQTPLGPGTYEGKFFDGRLLVRLPVNEETTKHLKDSNCLTPRAKSKGLWLFVYKNAGVKDRTPIFVDSEVK